MKLEEQNIRNMTENIFKDLDLYNQELFESLRKNRAGKELRKVECLVLRIIGATYILKKKLNDTR